MGGQKMVKSIFNFNSIVAIGDILFLTTNFEAIQNGKEWLTNFQFVHELLTIDITKMMVIFGWTGNVYQQ